MKIIEQSFKFTQKPGYNQTLETIDQAARTCYQSDPKGDKESFIRQLIKAGHESVIEHVNIGVEIITDRGISHELVRHRIGASYSQESSRYCSYIKQKFGSEIKVILPSGITGGSPEYLKWEAAMKNAENSYMNLLELGLSAQIARSVLPTCLATTIHVTLNLRSWRHFFKLRTSPRAHPDMRKLAIDMLQEFRQLWPVFFKDI